jgi:hypothetical protein
MAMTNQKKAAKATARAPNTMPVMAMPPPESPDLRVCVKATIPNTSARRPGTMKTVIRIPTIPSTIEAMAYPFVLGPASTANPCAAGAGAGPLPGGRWKGAGPAENVGWAGAEA